MPNMQVSGSSNKDNFDILVVDLTEDKDKKDKRRRSNSFAHITTYWKT